MYGFFFKKTNFRAHPNSLLSIPDISNFGTLQLHMENCLFQPTIPFLVSSRGSNFFQQFWEFFFRVIILGILRAICGLFPFQVHGIFNSSSMSFTIRPILIDKF